MSLQQFPSKLLEEAVFEFSKLPGIGDKTALRLVLHLLKQPPEDVNKFGNSLIRLKEEIIYCEHCGNISDASTCSICANPQRDHSTVCVVENIKDVMAIERTTQYNGVYNVLGAIISPMDGIGPNHLFLKGLDSKLENNCVNEIILALNTTLEGDTTNFYLYKRYKKFEVNISTLATGIAIGNDLEYTDEITLGRSIMNRMQFNPGK